jgi:hypothetical protein
MNTAKIFLSVALLALGVNAAAAGDYADDVRRERAAQRTEQPTQPPAQTFGLLPLGQLDATARASFEASPPAPRQDRADPRGSY